jgi:hypothetical protein
MDARNVVHACSNASVAQAAIFCMGGSFVTQFASEACRHRLGCGSFAAQLVKDFARNAATEDWSRANEATRGSDLPVLSCLRFILSDRLATAGPEAVPN